MGGLQIISGDCRRCSTGSSDCCTVPEQDLQEGIGPERVGRLDSPGREEPTSRPLGTLVLVLVPVPVRLRRSPVIALRECSPVLVCTPDCCMVVRTKDQMVLEACWKGIRPGRRQKERRRKGREVRIPWKGCSNLRERKGTWIGRRRIVVMGRRISIWVVRRRETGGHGPSGWSALATRNWHTRVAFIVDEGTIIYFTTALRTGLYDIYL
jgi:hypothetical protein